MAQIIHKQLVKIDRLRFAPFLPHKQVGYAAIAEPK